MWTTVASAARGPAAFNSAIRKRISVVSFQWLIPTPWLPSTIPPDGGEFKRGRIGPVSWNFRHIVHFDKIRLFNSVNLELGYKPLQIYSPREVTKA
jgi:hypothetical protein